MPDSVFVQIGIILGLAVAGGILARLFRQPLIVIFIAVGILLGPSGLGMVTHTTEVELFARLGIALLLFVVGLKLDLHVIRTVGPVALVSGLGQVIFTSVIGYVIGLLLGLSHIAAVYVAVALTFSSTIIIVKLLSDKREVDALHGRIAVGFLIVQDIVVVLVMIGLTAFGQAGAEDVNMGREVLTILIKGAVMLAAVAALMRYVLPALLRFLAHSSELLMLFAIAWAILGAAAGDALGFSKEVGAFLAGISIASTPWRDQIAARLVSMRDFLLVFFFIDLGAGLELSTLGAQVVPALVFSLFVLIGNPFIVMVIMGVMGYRKRTGFLAGLTVAQISEFSLILAAMGLNLGHLDQQTVGLITLVGLITISLSTYMILYSHQLYQRLAPWLSIFERRVTYREGDAHGEDEDVDVLLIGLGRFGTALAESLRDRDCRLLAVDFDPEAVRSHARDGYRVHYGDAEDPEFIASLPLSRIRWVVSTVRDDSINQMLLHALREQGYRGKVALTTAGRRNVRRLKNEGVDLVLIPYTDAAREAAARLAPDPENPTPATAPSAGGSV
jgi:Kef-type K+ transport system membrane component KefB